MKKINRLYFFGELPKNAVNGISLSNELNLKILNDFFEIKTMEESIPLRLHNRFSIYKFWLQAKNISFSLVHFLLKNYDVLYLSYSTSFLGSLKILIVVKAYKLLNNGIVVVHLHRGDFNVYIANKNNKKLSNLIFRSVDKLILISNKQRKYFDEYKKLNIYIIKNTVCVNLNFKKKLPNETKKNLIYISHYLEEKGVLDLLEAFSSIVNNYPNIYLNCYGKFSDSNLKSKIYSYNSDNIGIYGPIYGDEKFKKISESSLLILPSWNEGQPLILLEAMALGVPILATNTGDICEMLGSDYYFIYEPRDINALTEKIIYFLDLKKTDMISEHLMNRFHCEYSRESHRKNLIAAFFD